MKKDQYNFNKVKLCIAYEKSGRLSSNENLVVNECKCCIKN